MSTLGPRVLNDLAVPAGWDAAYLKKQELKDGTTYEAVIAQLVAAIGAFNTQLGMHTWLPSLTFQTQQMTVRYRTGGNTGRWRTHTELTPPDARRAEMTGHMIGKLKKDDALGWTWDWLNEAILEDIEADVFDFLTGALEMYEKAGLTRFYTIEDETIGTSGVSPGFVGGGSLAFTPPPYGGKTFAGHTHYLRVTTSSHGAAAAQMTEHLKEHGHEGPWELWIADDDKATWAAVDDDTNRAYFRQYQQQDVQYATTLSLASQGLQETYIGVVETPSGTAKVRPMPRVPSGWAAMFRPYGANTQQNPLRWWFNPRFGTGVVPISGDKLGWPVQKIMGYAEYGFGVGRDRTAAVLCKFSASGDYTTPPIT